VLDAVHQSYCDRIIPFFGPTYIGRKAHPGWNKRTLSGGLGLCQMTELATTNDGYV
jgi:hypothetical protein